MLDNIRTKVRGPWAIAIVLIISIPFIMFGVESIFSIGGSANNSVSVNGEDFSEQYIQGLIDRELASGQPSSPELRAQVIEQLVERTLFEQIVASMKLDLADNEIDKSIISDQQFSVDGRFSQDRLNNFLRQNGISGQFYRDSLRNELTINQIGSIFTEAEFVTPAEVNTNIALLEQTRDADIYKLSMQKMLDKVSLEEGEAQAFYEDNKSAFLSEEQVVIDYIELSIDAFSASVSKTEIEQAYKQEIDALKSQSERRISHIMLMKDGGPVDKKIAELQKIRQEIVQKGVDFATLAQQKSQDPGSKSSGGDLGILSPESFPVEFSEAAAKLAEGEISEPVVTDIGVHLIKATEVKAVSVPELAEISERLQQSIEETKVKAKFQEQLDKLVDISFTAADLIEPADELKLEIKTSRPFGRLSGHDEITSNQRLIASAFSDDTLIQKNNSEVIEISPTKYVVFHIKEHLPSKQKSFAAVKSEVTAMLKRSKANEEMRAVETQLVAELEQGGLSNTALAQKYAASLKTVKSVSINNENDDLSNELLQAIFTTQSPSADKVSVNTTQDQDDLYVIAVTHAELGSSAEIDAAKRANTAAIAQQLESLYAQQAFRQFLREDARVIIKSATDLETDES